MVAVLTRLFGAHHLDMAEDVVQESFVKALSSWRVNGLPDNPEAWLMQVAKNGAIDRLRKENLIQNKKNELPFSGTDTISLQNLFLPDEIDDAQLRMIFCCCDPQIKTRDQIAVTLNIVSGFSNQEIANALLLKLETVKKRVQRAKVQLKKAWQPFAFPQGEELLPRIENVLQVIYLLFNEGYHSAVDEKILRKELCLEAMRLGQKICTHTKVAHPNAYALLGLMCFHAARFDSRFDEQQEIILLADQDRKTWDMELLMQGHSLMKKAVDTKQYSSYHLEAAIIWEYMSVADLEATQWDRILDWYDQLIELQPTPFVQLNRAIAHVYAGKAEIAQELLAAIAPEDLASRRYLFHIAQGQVYLKSNRTAQAIDEWLIAHSLAPSQKEKRVLEKKIEAAK